MPGHDNVGFGGQSYKLLIYYPYKAGHWAISSNVSDCIIAKVPAHNSVNTKSYGICQSHGAERSVETTIQSEELK